MRRLFLIVLFFSALLNLNAQTPLHKLAWKKAVEESTSISASTLWYDFTATSGTTAYDQTDNNLDGANDANVTIQYNSEDAFFWPWNGETVVSDNDLLTPAGAFSIAFWVNPATDGVGVCQKSSEYSIYFSSAGILRFRIFDGGGSTYIQGQMTSAMSTGSEHFVVCSFDGSGDETGISIYVDGALQTLDTSGSNAASATVSNTTNVLYVGNTSTSGGLRSYMKQFILFFEGEELDSDARTELYNSGTKLYYSEISW